MVMANDIIRTYAMMRNQIVEWDQFAIKNEWATIALDERPVTSTPDHCVAVYYVVDNEKKEITQKLFVTTWDAKYKSEFKDLNLKWVSTLFKVEKHDLHQLNHPEENIVKPGGQIIFVLEENHEVAGTVAMVLNDDGQHKECQLAKMTVAEKHQGKGYAHPLMREGIAWARRQGHPDVTLYSSVSLDKAISLYKKHGFITTHLGPHPSYERCSIIMQLQL